MIYYIDSVFLTFMVLSTVAELFSDEVQSADIETADVDLGAEYWHQEHHRFEYSQHAQLMCRLNPLSFHQMGVAVPGSFVEPGQFSTIIYKRAEYRRAEGDGRGI